MTPFYIKLDSEWHIIRVVDNQGWTTYCDRPATTGSAKVSQRIETGDRLCAKCDRNYETRDTGSSPGKAHD